VGYAAFLDHGMGRLVGTGCAAARRLGERVDGTSRR